MKKNKFIRGLVISIAIFTSVLSLQTSLTYSVFAQVDDGNVNSYTSTSNANNNTNTVSTITIDSSCNSNFLTIPAWYNNLSGRGSDGKCAMVSPSSLGEGEAGLTKFIWRIALNFIEIGMNLVAYLAFFFVLYGGFQYLTSSGNPEQASKGRSTIFNALIGVVIAASAAAIVGELSKLTTSTATASGMSLLTEILNLVYMVAAATAVVVIIIAGYGFTTGGDNPKSVETARNRILYAVIGLVIIGAAYAITNYVVEKVL